MESKNKHLAKSIAVFGTGSDVGKSIITTALCRFLFEKQFHVAPFKAQNMSNNSGVTPEGLEMGRAQIVQAEASGIPPHVDMNPILLKPTSEIGAQIVLHGKILQNSTAAQYHEKKKDLFQSTCEALNRLQCDYDVVVIEGAGSCAEVNLMPDDIVNFRIAEYADAPVILVADIHRGGVFAQIVGTLECLSAKEKRRIAGFIVNRFRGDISLFEEGVRWIEKKTGKKVLGVLPWYDHIHIEAEDSVVIEKPSLPRTTGKAMPSIGVIRFPHISNFTDFHPLSQLKNLSVCFIDKPKDIASYAAIILPGSKNTRFDLNWLQQNGWEDIIQAYTANGGHVLGICGGYQMLGRMIHDPEGLEGLPGSSKGLDLLPVETVLSNPKTTTLTSFLWGDKKGTGYEIHMGQTKRGDSKAAFRVLSQNGKPCDNEDGCIRLDSRVMGTYIHGLFDNPEITKKWLAGLGLGHIDVSDIGGLAAREKEYALLSEHFKKFINTETILKLI
ncbi:MAG: cobyric acid synthase [Desulfobacterales bacterium]